MLGWPCASQASPFYPLSQKHPSGFSFKKESVFDVGHFNCQLKNQVLVITTKKK